MIRFRVYLLDTGEWSWTLFQLTKPQVTYLGYGRAATKKEATEAAIRAIREMEV